MSGRDNPFELKNSTKRGNKLTAKQKAITTMEYCIMSHIHNLYTPPKNETTLLPTDFLPGPYCVVIAKGSTVRTSASGNDKLRELIQSQLDTYSQAKLRKHRTAIVTNILHSVQQLCNSSCADDERSGDIDGTGIGAGTAPHRGAYNNYYVSQNKVPAFVKFDGGHWWEVDENVARHKITSTFRDLLADKYKSSTKRKVAKRRAERKKKVVAVLEHKAHGHHAPPPPPRRTTTKRRTSSTTKATTFNDDWTIPPPMLLSLEMGTSKCWFDSTKRSHHRRRTYF